MPTRPPIFRPGYLGDPSAGEAARKRRLDRRRPSPAERGYDSDWRRVRAEVLEERPFCERCGTTEALEVHHVQSIAEAPHLRLDKGNLAVLCKAHHSAITAKEQGFASNGSKNGLSYANKNGLNSTKSRIKS